jgi:methyltransferase-like protein 6
LNPAVPLTVVANDVSEFKFGGEFTCAGPAPYMGDILENPDLVLTEDQWTSEDKCEAERRLGLQGRSVSEFWKNQYETKAGKYWHEFYKRNLDKFFHDRHYLHVVFPELASEDHPLHLLECGCGVGNAVLPLLEINSKLRVTAIDFAESAIEILRSHDAVKNQGRVRAEVVNLVNDDLPVEASSADLVLCMFVLSAIAPQHLREVFCKLYRTLKPGGKLLFRDYGRFDEAQLRFSKGSKLDDNFYVRQDGTCSYFFDLDELKQMCTEVGFSVEEAYYIRRQYANRLQRQARHRIWIHGKFVKK